MRSRWFHRPIVHTPTLGLEKRPTWLELFYDLIFVAAFIQLGNGLAEHVTIPGLGTFVGVFIPLWVAWTGFTFFENRFDLDDFGHRTMVLFQMLAVGGMAISAPYVLDGDLLGFSLAAGTSLSLVSLMYLRAFLQVDEARDYSRFWGMVFGLGGAAWLAAAVLPLVAGISLAALGTLAILAAPLSRHSRELAARFPVDFEHLGERYGLLTIIVLGESFVKVLGALGEGAPGPTVYLQGGIVLLITSGVWWVYFDDVAGAKVREGKGQWVVWLYSHMPLQMAIVALGVALKKAVRFDWEHPAPLAYTMLLAGSLGLVYLAVAAIDSVAERRQAELSDRARVNARAFSGILLLLLGAAGGRMSGMLFFLLVLAVNVAQVVFDMMTAPLEESEHSEIGARSTADLARDRIARGDVSERSEGRRPRVQVGNAVRKGIPSELRSDLYFYFIEGSWWRVFAAFAGVFIAVNVFFAALFSLELGSIDNAPHQSFADAFFFSVQTIATIGYGAMHPGSVYGDVVATVEAAVGLVGAAVMTGIVFAKLSRPSSAVVFSQPMVITKMHGDEVLMFRCGNARGSEFIDAEMRLTVLKEEMSPEGHHLRRLHDLELTRGRSPVFSLTWMAMHILDESSPIHGVSWGESDCDVLSFIVTIVGHDGTYGQTAYARHVYYPEDVKPGARFIDIIDELPDGRLMVDYERLHDTELEATR